MGADDADAHRVFSGFEPFESRRSGAAGSLFWRHCGERSLLGVTQLPLE